MVVRPVPLMDPMTQLNLPPGFRFYPTDEELIVQYLCPKVAGNDRPLQIIEDVNLYKFDPWELPSKAMFGEKEWYFFSPRDRKYPNGSRPNRVSGSGYWKATGTDKVITSEGRKVGIKKALVFYVGKAPKGSKTNWIMHEYRLSEPSKNKNSSRLDDLPNLQEELKRREDDFWWSEHRTKPRLPDIIILPIRQCSRLTPGYGRKISKLPHQ